MKANRNLYNPTKFNNIREIIGNAVNLYPNNIAFIIKNKIDKEVTYTNITYKKFQEDSNSLGTKLIDLGLKRIAIIGKNSYEWALSSITVLSGVRSNSST